MKDEELKRLKLLAAQMPKERLAGISQTESSGNPNAIGDVGAKAGSSIGLNQIQSQTARDLYKKGLLPKEWNGQKVKKNNLKKFLLDPDFNNLAAGVLYSDNKRILRKKAADKMIFTTEEQLDDWATKAHNQGVTKTLQREVYGNEAMNPKVQKYLEKVKGQSAFDNGGVVHDEFQLDPNAFSFDPEFQQPLPEAGPTVDEQLGQMSLPEAPIEAPIEAPVESEVPEMDLLAQYQAALEEDRKKQESVDMGNAGIGIANQLAKYTSMIQQGKTAQKTGRRAPKIAPVNFGKIEASKSKSNELLKKAGLMKTLAGLKGGNKNKLALAKFDYKKEQDKINKEIKSEEKIYKREQAVQQKEFKERQFVDKVNARVAKSVGTGDIDPKSQASITARKEAEFLTGRVFPESFSEAKVNKIVTALARKIESGYQTKRYDLSKERLGQAGEKLELSKDKEEQRKTEKTFDIKLKADNNIYGVTKDFEGNALKKELDKQGISFEQANMLIGEIKSGNELALGSLGTKMARAMGEVGVLTDQDVVRYIQSQSILRQGKDYYERLGKGRLYEETLHDMEAVIKKMQGGFATREKEIFERYTKRAYENFGKQAGLSREEIYTRFGMKYRLEKKKTESPYGDKVERNGKSYKWNATKGKYQLAR